jgi:hypothetical protein
MRSHCFSIKNTLNFFLLYKLKHSHYIESNEYKMRYKRDTWREAGQSDKKRRGMLKMLKVDE